jgi:CheY-like chemotaxis protein
LRLLVVEDEPLIALDLVSRLEAAGAVVAPPASTEKRALQAMEEGGDFDAALLDANLNGHSVDKVAAALHGRNIPFLFITGYGRAGLPASFRHAVVLAKPFGDRQLIEAVSAMAAKSARAVPLAS